MRAPTARQIEVLRAIAAHIRRNGYPPTLRELAPVLGVVSFGSLTKNIRALERKGVIGRKHGGFRAITLLDAAGRFLGDLADVVPRGPAEVLEPVRCTRCGAESFAPERPCFGCYLAVSEQSSRVLRPRLRIAAGVG